MKKLFLTLILSTLAYTGYAIPACQPCSISVGAEWIYFQPILDVPVYAYSQVVSGGNANTTYTGLDNVAAWQSGFRIFGEYTLCNTSSVYLRWTSFGETWNDEEASSSLIALVPENGSGNIATASERLRYDALDFLFAHTLYDACRLFISGNMGLHYAHVRLKEEYSDFSPPNFLGSSNTDTVLYHSNFWGVGPEIGLDIRYLLFPNFSLVGKANGSILIGRNAFHAEIHNTTVSGGGTAVFHRRLNAPRTPRIFPEIDMRLGFNYLFSYRKFTFDLEVGYEGLLYFRALPQNYNAVIPSLNTSSTENTPIAYNNVGFHGPYLSFTTTF